MTLIPGKPDTCSEFSAECEYREHWKCGGTFDCPDGYGEEYCACNCHFEGNEHLRSKPTLPNPGKDD